MVYSIKWMAMSAHLKGTRDGPHAFGQGVEPPGDDDDGEDVQDVPRKPRKKDTVVESTKKR